jgi:chromosome segregation ATPase
LTDDLPPKLESIEKKIKLSNLLSGKKFADLELSIGKLEEKFKEFSTGIPELRERAEEIEDLLNVINLGLVGYKKKFAKIDARFKTIENIPENVKKSMFEYEKKLRALNENINKISTKIDSIKPLEQEVVQKVEDEFLPELKNLKKDFDDNKLQIEHVKRELDAFATSVKSFERTVKLTNLDKIIERFDSIDDKIVETQVQVEGFKKTLSGISMADVDVKRLEEELKDLSSTVMDKTSELNELQRDLKIINQRMRDFDFFGTISQLKADLKNKQDMILDDRARIEELRTRIDRISEMSVEHLKPIRGGDKEIKGKMADLDFASVQEMYNKSEEMYKDMAKRISLLQQLDEKLTMFESEARSRTLPPDVNDILTKVNERLENVEDRYNEVLNVLKNEMKSLKEKTDTPQVDKLNEKIKEFQKVLSVMDKDLSRYQKQMEKRIRGLEDKKEEKIPKEIVEKINSLENSVSFLSKNNKELRQLATEIRMAQLESVNARTFADVIKKIKVIEKKMAEFETGYVEELSKSIPSSEVINDVFERLEMLEKKISSFENMFSKGNLAQKKEFESLIDIKSDLEKQITDLKKKINEQSSVQPVILE